MAQSFSRKNKDPAACKREQGGEMKSRQHSGLLGAPKHCIPDIQQKKPSPLTIFTQHGVFFYPQI